MAVLALVAGACGGDDDEKADETTTTAEPTETTTTLSDEAFSSQISEYEASVEAAGTDLCALAASQSSSPPTPANPAQMKEFVELYAMLLRSFAASIPEDPTTVKALNDTAEALQKEAEAAGYPPEFLMDPEAAPKSLTTEEFQAANTALTAKAQPCATTTTIAGEGETTTTTVAG